VRQYGHPLSIVPPHLARLLDDDYLEEQLIQPEKLNGDAYKQKIYECVNQLETAAEQALNTEQYGLYRSLTYLSDAFIPVLLLAEDCGPVEIQKEQIRKFWPCVDKNVMHEGQLPALMHLVLQCCYWADNSKKAIPIVHMMTKGIPKRCQVRSFIDIIDKKQQEDKSIMNFILDVFNCFALGGYEHSRQRPVFDVRVRLYKNLIFSSGAKDHIRKWFMDSYMVTTSVKGVPKKKKVYRHANIVTLAVREYLCTCIQLLPSLHEVLVDRCDWASFEKDVFSTADSARQLMNDNYAIKHYWFEGMDSAVNSKKSGKESNIYQPIKNAFVSTLLNYMDSVETNHLCEQSADARYLHEQLDPGVQDLLRAALSLYEGSPITVTEDIPADAEECARFVKERRFPLCCFGCSRNSAAAIRATQKAYYKEERAKYIQLLVQKLWRDPLSTVDFALTSFLFRQRGLCSSVNVQLLPAHYILYQYMAIVTRYGLPQDTSLQYIAQNYGKIYVCTQCRTVRSFVVTPETNAKSASFYAYGNSRVVIDHNTKKIYCTGKKRDGKTGVSTSYKTLENIINCDNFNPLDAEKALKKERKRRLKKEGEKKQSSLCRQTEIARYPILGKILHFFGKSYILCCHCARITEFNGRRYYQDAFVCGCCTEEKSEELPVICSLCEKKERKKGSFGMYQDIVSDAGGGHGERITIHLCPSHNKSWIAAEYRHHAEQPLSMSRIIQGNEEAWRTTTTSSGTSVTLSRFQPM